MSTISPASASVSAITSSITVRTMRFLSRASVVGADQTVLRFSASDASEGNGVSRRGVNTASWWTIFASIPVTCSSARFQRASNSAATRRLAGSAASYWRNARSAA